MKTQRVTQLFSLLLLALASSKSLAIEPSFQSLPLATGDWYVLGTPSLSGSGNAVMGTWGNGLNQFAYTWKPGRGFTDFYQAEPGADTGGHVANPDASIVAGSYRLGGAPHAYLRYSDGRTRDLGSDPGRRGFSVKVLRPNGSRLYGFGFDSTLNTVAYTWDDGIGFRDMGLGFNSQIKGESDDQRILGGRMGFDGLTEPIRIKDGVIERLSPGHEDGVGAMTGDGRTCLLGSNTLWREGSGLFHLPAYNGHTFAAAGMSRDGSTVFGYFESSANHYDALIYRNGRYYELRSFLTMHGVMNVPELGKVTGISDDGMTFTGVGGPTAHFYASVPEPSTLFAFGFGGLALLLRKKLRK